MKRILSVFAALAVCLSLLPISALAAEPFTRISGKTRFETGYAAADTLMDTLSVERFDTVIVANAYNFADALSGSYLAAVKSAPILLVSDTTAGQLRAYLEQHLSESGTVYLLGGTGAVSQAVEDTLSGLTVKRLAGKSRYETNLAILAEAGIGDHELLVCTGTGFADSLSASAAGKPILMVGKALTDAQMQLLEQSGGRFVIIGGTGAVGSGVEEELKALGTVERLSGKGRYETSVLVAQRFFTSPTQAVLAYARNFPDGLCGGPLAYTLGTPLLLTQTGNADAADAYAETLGLSSGYVLGGASLISDATARTIFTRAAEAPPAEHTHSYTTVTVSPAVGQQGFDLHTCACGHSHKDNFTDPLPAPDGPGAQDSVFVDQLVKYINQYRAEAGLEPLTSVNNELALVRAAELTVSFSHTRPDGTTVRDAGISAECCLAGYGSALAAANALYKSPELQAEILSPTYTTACAAYNNGFWVVLLDE